MASNKGKELCGDDGKNTNVPDVILSGQNVEFELKVGMTANSEQEAFDLYNNYAYNKGFSIRKDKKIFKHGTNELSRRKYVCSKEGFREFAEPGEVRKVERLDTRCGCRARVVFKVENGVYEIDQLITEHNHPLVEPNQRHLIRSARKIHNTSKGGVKSMGDVGIKTTKTYPDLSNEPSGYEDVGFARRDSENFLQAADCQSLINYFKHKQVVEQMFFYTVQVDEENRIANFFWRDGLSKLDYECLGDVVIFDTTYRTDKYNLICAPFTGVNHHGKNLLYGCAFLSDETTSSFVWLFNAFLESMDGKAPKTIFTDRGDAMADAIVRVFPNTHHRLCPWHISKNAISSISSLYQQPGFKSTFSDLLEKCESEAEFEEKWAKMIEEWGCSNESWLLKLYDLREKWAPAFNRDTFSCNIRSSPRSVSLDNIFQHVACKTMTLVELVHHYEQNVEKMRDAEVIDDYNCANGKPRILSRSSGILQHACRLYTHKLFAVFQDEFMQSLSVMEIESIHNDTHHMYKLRMEDSTGEHIVQFNSSDLSISCSCKQFESLGLLCCHALRVLNLNGVNKIPEQYILRRWTKAVKHGLELVRNNILPANTSGNSAKTVRLNKLMRKAFSLMNSCANSEATTEIADRYLDNIFREVTKHYATLSEGADVLDDTSPTYGKTKGSYKKKKRKLGNTPKSTSQLATNTMPSVRMQSSVMGHPNLYPPVVQMSANGQNQFIPIFRMPPPNVHTSIPAANTGVFKVHYMKSG